MNQIQEFLLKYALFSPIMITMSSLLYITRADKFTFSGWDLLMTNLAGLGLLFVFALITGLFLNIGKR